MIEEGQLLLHSLTLLAIVAIYSRESLRQEHFYADRGYKERLEMIKKKKVNY